MIGSANAIARKSVFAASSVVAVHFQMHIAGTRIFSINGRFLRAYMKLSLRRAVQTSMCVRHK